VCRMPQSPQGDASWQRRRPGKGAATVARRQLAVRGHPICSLTTVSGNRTRRMMSAAVAAIIGAAIGALATVTAVTVQAMLSNRAGERQRREVRDSDRERQRRELVQRYLFQLQGK
jgi:predicted aconitase